MGVHAVIPNTLPEEMCSFVRLGPEPELEDDEVLSREDTSLVKPDGILVKRPWWYHSSLLPPFELLPRLMSLLSLLCTVPMGQMTAV